MTVSKKIIFLSVPGLRTQDLDLMPRLMTLCSNGSKTKINHSFPCVTWPSQANMLTGKNVSGHGVIANGFYWRDTDLVEMWTAWNEVIEQPQVWDVLKKRNPSLKSAVWFPMLSKGCGADYVCMPAPIHKPDGSEELWCYTKPQEFYGQLSGNLQHFPLQHFWGPLANIKSSKWIADSAVIAAAQFQPDFFYIYLPHLDYAAQKNGPDSDQALAALTELDDLIGGLGESMSNIYGDSLTWMVASEYTINPVDHVLYPNRMLREAGLLKVKIVEGKEHLDFEKSEAWALVDHQFSHLFLKDDSDSVVETVRRLFENADGIDSILTGPQRADLSMDHKRCGEIILVSTENSWQAYYWWIDDGLAPEFASSVDIHRKPGYDPIELHFDFTTKSVPLDASLAKGSHGAPPSRFEQMGPFLCSEKLGLPEEIRDTEIFELVLSQFPNGSC